MARTHNNDLAYNSTGDVFVEFFSKAGSLFEKREPYYGNEVYALDLFKPMWVTDKTKAMKLAMWLRDCRGGASNRSGFRSIMGWIANKEPEWIKSNLHLIPLYGRWDDLKTLENTPCEEEAFKFWIRAIQEGNGLAAKWAPRSSKTNEKRKILFNKLRKMSGMSPKEFRKLLVQNTNVVENKMCSKEWQDVDYNKVPSVAMARYNNAFKKNDPARFDEWKNALAKGVDKNGNEVKVNASVLFPHDCLRTLCADICSEGVYGTYNYPEGRDCTYYEYEKEPKYYESKVANAQFNALPNYMEGINLRIMAICDFSGSMISKVSGEVLAIDVSMGLGLYCSDRLGKDNPFYRKFIPFSNDSKLVSWENETFSVAAQKHNDGFCGSTNIRSALDQILDAAKMFKVTNDQIPNCLLIISDMQFDQGTRDDMTSVEAGIKEWEKSGYNRPKILYWNVNAYSGSPSTVNHPNVGLVSGFSPSILKSILGGDDFSPMAILDRAIEKYEVVVPQE